MKRRNLFRALFGLGAAAVPVAAAVPARKTDLGIPPVVDAETTPFAQDMDVFVDRGNGEELFSTEHVVLRVDTTTGEALVLRKMPNPKHVPGREDLFGYSREYLSVPTVYRGDFRVRWQHGYQQA